jgi:hypothetical protein
MKKLLILVFIFISSAVFFALGVHFTEGQSTYPQCLHFEVTFNATGWNSSIMGETMDVGCAGDYGSAGCRGEVKAVKPGNTVSLDQCTCTPYGDPRYGGKGCLVIGHNLKMEDYNAGGGITRRRVMRADNDPLLPSYCTLTVKGKTYDYRSTEFFPSQAQYEADPTVTFCGTNGTERDKAFSIDCSLPTTPPPTEPPPTEPPPTEIPTPEPTVPVTPGVSTCPTPAQVTNVKITCPNCYSDITPTPTIEQPTN